MIVMNTRFFSLTVFSAVQWVFFLFANTIVIPVSVGAVFDLPEETVSIMIRASLVLTGIVSVLQGWKGHRFPLMEGHSGILWGLLLNLGVSASALGLTLPQIGGGIATGVLLASAVTILIAICGGIRLLQSIFSPMVMSVYLFLLSLQLIFIFFKGMLGIDDAGVVDVPVSLLSLFIVALVILLKLKGNETISNFSILIGLVIGWILYMVVFGTESGNNIASTSEGGLHLFPLGKPNLEFGIIAVAFCAGMLNTSNTIVSISAAQDLLNKKSKGKHYRQSLAVTSVFTVIGTCFGLIPYTPYASTIGFLQSTKIFDKKPFYIGGILLAVIGLIPPLGSFLAGMPITVGNAVLFVAYLQLLGTALSSLDGIHFNSDTIFRFATPVLVGAGLMNVSPAVFSELPVLIQPIITNGLIMGMLISIVLERLINWKQYE